MDLLSFLLQVQGLFHTGVFYLTTYKSLFGLVIIEWLHILSVVLISKSKNSHINQTLVQRLFAIFMHSFGGFLIIGISTAQISTCFNHSNLLFAMFICYLIVFYCPFDLIFKVLAHSKIWPWFKLFIETFAISTAIFEWSEEVIHGLNHANHHSNILRLSFSGIVFVVAFACEGGDFIADTFDLHDSHWKFKTPNILNDKFPCGLFPTFISTFIFCVFLYCDIFELNSCFFLDLIYMPLKSFFNLSDVKDFIILMLLFFNFNIHILMHHDHDTRLNSKHKDD